MDLRMFPSHDNDATSDFVMDTEDGTTTSANFSTGNTISNRDPILDLKGLYHTGDYKREIRQDAEVENWTLVSANPTFPEKLFLRIRPDFEGVAVNSGDSGNRPLKFKMFVRIEYLTEFKELKDELHWPIGYQPATFTLVAKDTQAVQNQNSDVLAERP